MQRPPGSGPALRSDPPLRATLNTDPDHHVAIGARLIDAAGRVAPPIIGVARYFRSEGSHDTAEPAVVVVDELGRMYLKTDDAMSKDKRR